ncbi:MAG: SusD/RagB family nutrient-binding outer membrane lipoprotein [Chlorobi bacterium]|nr:SusD/RagB family nutrient-binding outer membrane lipoprotein [Chlorobiota bacterium]
MKKSIFLISIVFTLVLMSCTDDFTDINTNPNIVTPDEASGRYFITKPQVALYGPNRYPYWRAQLIHTDRYSGHFCFGHHGSWWSDELGYSYSMSYTDATWDWLAGYSGGLDNYMKLTAPGGEFENELMYAVGKILKGLYFQMYTDVFGDIPYSQVGDPDIVLPKFDTQKDIYKGIIADLEDAIATIGDNERTGQGIDDLGENDVYFNGDLQKWKKLANTLIMRIALRAKGAPGDDFSDNSIRDAIARGFFLEEGEDCVLPKDSEISQWSSACYGDIWWNFGGLGSKWTVGETLINYLIENNDPRIEKYVNPAIGGQFSFTRPDEESNPDGYANFEKRIRFIAHVISKAIDIQGGDTTNVLEFATDLSSATITVPENQYYIGQPTRLNSFIKSFARFEFFCTPADYIIQEKFKGKPISPELIMTSAESYFLQAQAALDGYGGDAQTLYTQGLTSSMKYWGVEDGKIADFLSSGVPMTQVSAENIAIQRWINAYTDGFEAWAIVRKTGFPKELSDGVHDNDIFGPGDINGAYPTRMQYGTSAYNKNGDNLQEALDRQGPDKQDTKLWFQLSN